MKNYVPRNKDGVIYEFEDFATKEDLIHGFYVEKIYWRVDGTLPASRSKYINPKTLRIFYTRFLNDKINHEKSNRYGEVSYEVAAKEYYDSKSYKESYNYNISEDRDFDAVENKSKVIYREYSYNSKFSTLHDLHKTYEEIEDSAKQWLSQQEHWVKIFLGRSYCPDSENSEALNKLAKRENIKSYAYKAEQLGFNWKHENNTNKKFENTMIGQWISTLNIEICEENIKVIVEILKILCLTALSLVDEENI